MMYQKQIDLLREYVELYPKLLDVPESAANELVEFSGLDDDTVHIGLCQACDLYGVPYHTRRNMFDAWDKTTGSWVFPVADEPDDLDLRNPLRLELAKHCITYLEEYK